MGDFNKDRDRAAHIHLNEYKNLLLKNNPPAIEPVWGSFCYGADWARDYYTTNSKDEIIKSMRGDGEIYCYVCEKTIGIAPDKFSVFYDKADNNEPKAIHSKCLARVIKISKSSFART